jgi:Asp-tRNA(Asn)/Glu-tRNA(Gln) amidotransferase A subunit family amidase
VVALCQLVNHVVFPLARPGCHCLYIQPDSHPLEPQSSLIFTTDTKAYLLRIEETNAVLRAVTKLNPDALSITAGLDAERAKGVIRSALHGIPMLIKNNIATNDQMNNTASSYSL